MINYIKEALLNDLGVIPLMVVLAVVVSFFTVKRMIKNEKEDPS